MIKENKSRGCPYELSNYGIACGAEVDGFCRRKFTGLCGKTDLLWMLTATV
jgi:hypothetical protein